MRSAGVGNCVRADYLVEQEGDECCAVVVEEGPWRKRDAPNRAILDTLIDAFRPTFHQRREFEVSALARVWWHGEHGGSPAVPFDALSEAELEDVRARVRELGRSRACATLGDTAVLEAPSRLAPVLLAHASHAAMIRANTREYSSTHVAAGFFAGEHAALALGANGVAYRVRQGTLERLTHQQAMSDHLRENYALSVPTDYLALGMCVVSLAPGDVFLLATRGFFGSMDDDARLLHLLAAPPKKACRALLQGHDTEVTRALGPGNHVARDLALTVIAID